MRTSKVGRRTAISASLLASVALALPLAPQAAATTGKALPVAITNGAQHVLPTSALLAATIDPNGKETSYFFQYGPTTAYGLTTPTLSAGSGTVKVKVGQAVSRLQPNALYHFRVVAMSSAGTTSGSDRTFGGKATRLSFSVSTTPKQGVFGSPLLVSGTLSGVGGANHGIVLQSSPFPFLEAFSNITPPTVTNAVGGFSFHVPSLLTSTQFRVITVDPRPLYSKVLTARVAVHVSFHARFAGPPGFVRLYGTVTPAVAGATVAFQLQKAVRPGKSGQAIRHVTQFTSVVRKGTKSFSRFSTVVRVRRGGRYRAFVTVPNGRAVVSGPSQTSIVLHAAPTAKRGGAGH